MWLQQIYPKTGIFFGGEILPNEKITVENYYGNSYLRSIWNNFFHKTTFPIGTFHKFQYICIYLINFPLDRSHENLQNFITTDLYLPHFNILIGIRNTIRKCFAISQICDYMRQQIGIFLIFCLVPIVCWWLRNCIEEHFWLRCYFYAYKHSE